MWVFKLFILSLHYFNICNIFLEYKDGLMKVGIFCFVAVGFILLLHEHLHALNSFFFLYTCIIVFHRHRSIC